MHIFSRIGESLCSHKILKKTSMSIVITYNANYKGSFSFLLNLKIVLLQRDNNNECLVHFEEIQTLYNLLTLLLRTKFPPHKKMFCKKFFCTKLPFFSLRCSLEICVIFLSNAAILLEYFV